MGISRTRIQVRPMAGTLGADIHGVDLSQALDDAAFAEIERAFHDRLVLLFHDQRLTPEQHLAFSRRFGPLSRSPYIKHMDEHPDIIAVLKEADERNISTFGNAWHSDFSFLEEPPLGSVLYARQVPDHGGDTLFANMYAAYDTLSEGMQRMLDGLNAMHSGRPYGVGGVPADLKVSRSIGIARNRPEADGEVAIGEMHRILDAIRKGDADGAYRASADHVRTVAELARNALTSDAASADRRVSSRGL